MHFKSSLLFFGIIALVFIPTQSSAQASAQTRQQAIDNIVLSTALDNANSDVGHCHSQLRSCHRQLRPRKEKFTKTHYNLAVKYIEQNKLDKAEKLLFKTLENPGLHKEIFYQLAVISDIRGEDDKKQQYLHSFYATLDSQHPAWRKQSGL